MQRARGLDAGLGVGATGGVLQESYGQLAEHREIVVNQRQRLAEEKARASSDAQLLRIYSEPKDVDRARDRKLAELDGLISVAQSNLHSLRTQQANLQAKAAEFERAGREVPEHLLVQIDNIKAEQAGVEKDIQRYRDNRTAAEATFAADRARLVKLRGE